METGSRARRSRSVYIEYLEKRIAPATFVVTNLNDAGAGSLRDAVDDANARPGPDTIVFRGAATNGEIALTTGEIDITDSVNIEGPGAGKLIIDAQNLSRIFRIDDNDSGSLKRVTISGLSMVDGTAGPGSGSPGGGIFSTESLTLINSVVSGCEAPAGPGGGILAFTSGKVVIMNSKIVGNTAVIDGGGLWLRADAGIQVINSLISGNAASSESGGVYAHIPSTGRGDILLQGVKITNNVGLSGGGALLDNDRENGNGNKIGRIIVRNALVSGNTARIDGGGIYLQDGNALIERSTISNNTATEHGGGINDNALVSLTIRSSQVSDNTVSSTAPYGDGGGIYINNDRRVTIQRTLIAGNSATGNGGGLFATQSTIEIISSTIRENLAAGFGGGVSTTGFGAESTDIRIVGSLFAANRALDAGGGVDTQGDGDAIISSSRFLYNSAGTDGGGLYLRSNSGRISITNSLIAYNSARDDAGGLALFRDTGVANITNTVIKDNIAAGDDGGGVGIFTRTGVVTFTASRVTGNVAANQGGGIYTQGANVVLNGSLVTGNTAPIAPQIYGPFTP